MSPLHDVEKLIGLVVDTLQVSIRGKHVQPVGIENVDLVGVSAQRRETGCVPRHIKRGPDAFFLVQRDLRGRQLRFAVGTGRGFFWRSRAFSFSLSFRALKARFCGEKSSSGKWLIVQSGINEKDDQRGNQDGRLRRTVAAGVSSGRVGDHKRLVQPWGNEFLIVCRGGTRSILAQGRCGGRSES